MKTIYKYELDFGATGLALPRGAQVLDVQFQNGVTAMWVLHDTRLPKLPRTFVMYGTGHTLPDDPGQYVATFQMSGGALVFHVFETTVVTA